MDQGISIINNQGWSLAATFRPNKHSVQLTSPAGTIIKNPVLMIANDRLKNGSVSENLQKEFHKLSQSKITFGFQIYKKNGRVFVVFDRYGLEGGVSKNKGMVLAVVEIAAGVWLYVKPEGTQKAVGASLVAAGVDGVFYAYKSNEQELDGTKFLKDSLSGVALTVVAGSISKHNPIKDPRVKAIVDSLLANATSLVFKNGVYIYNERRFPNLRAVVTEFGYSSVASILTAAASLSHKHFLDHFRSGGNNMATAFGRGFLLSGLEGGISSAIRTTSESLCDKQLGRRDRAWRERLNDVIKHAISSGTCGAVEGLSNFIENYPGVFTKPDLLRERYRQERKKCTELHDEKHSLEEDLRKIKLEITDLENSVKNDPVKLQQLRQKEAALEQNLRVCSDDIALQAQKLRGMRYYSPNSEVRDVEKIAEMQGRLSSKAQEITDTVTKLRQASQRENLPPDWQAWLNALEGLAENDLKLHHSKPTERAVLFETQKALESDCQQIQNKILSNDPTVSGDTNINGLQSKILTGLKELQKLQHEYQVIRTQEHKKQLQRQDYYEARWIRLQNNPPVSQVDAISKSQLPRLFAYAPNEISFVEIDQVAWNELTAHIVLVHGISPACLKHLMKNYPQVDGDKFVTDSAYQAETVLTHFLTPEGELGSHMDFSSSQFQKRLVDRPHISWVWNQLVQSHGRGYERHEALFSWENCPIAILESLSKFENTQQGVPYSVAPYDTLTIGTHQLSAQSIVIVPQIIEEIAKNYFNDGFQGKVVSFDPEKKGGIRKAIFEIMNDNFEDIWHVIDPYSGQLMAPEVHPTPDGYPPVTCLQKGDGSIFTLIHGEGRKDSQLISPAMQEAKRSGRFIGLHGSSWTAWLEDRPAFKALNKFTKNKDRLRTPNPLFAGYATEDRNDLAICWALEFYVRMQKFALQTGVHKVAEYVLNEMIHADLASVYFKNFPDTELDFTPYELALMISTNRDHIINLIAQFSVDRTDPQNFDRYFRPYQELLFQLILSMQKARLELEQTLTQPIEEEDLGIIEANITQSLDTEWSRVCDETAALTPIRERWPPTLGEQDFLYKIRDYVSDDLNKLASVWRAATAQPAEPEQLKLSYVSYSLELRLKEIFYLREQRKYFEEQENCFASIDFPFGLRLANKTLAVGNCLFDNIASQIYPLAEDQELSVGSMDLRAQCVTYMRSCPADFEPFFTAPGKLTVDLGRDYWYSTWDEYLDGLALNGVWADELVLRAMASFLKRSVVKVTSGQLAPTVYYQDSEQEPIFIAHIGKIGFASLKLAEEGTVRQILQAILSESDPLH